MHLLRTLARGGVAPVTRREFSIAQPAVATGFTISPENGRAWSVESVTFQLQTDSNVANRTVAAVLSDSARALWAVPSAAVQAASAIVQYSFIHDFPTAQVATVGGYQAVPLPTTILLPGWSLIFGIPTIQVGDQISLAAYSVLESFVGDTEAEYNTARAVAHHAAAIAELLEGEVPGL